MHTAFSMQAGKPVKTCTGHNANLWKTYLIRFKGVNSFAGV